MSDTAHLKAKFTEMWMHFADEHSEELNIGDWLHVFGALSGMSMALAHVDEEAVDDIVNSQSEVTKNVYQDALANFHKQQTVQ